MINLPLPCAILTDGVRTTDFIVAKSSIESSAIAVQPLGINNQRKSYELQWVGLSLAQRKIVEIALDTIGTWGFANFIPFDSLTPVKLQAISSYTITLHRNLYIINCTFIQILT